MATAGPLVVTCLLFEAKEALVVSTVSFRFVSFRRRSGVQPTRREQPSTPRAARPSRLATPCASAWPHHGAEPISCTSTTWSRISLLQLLVPTASG